MVDIQSGKAGEHDTRISVIASDAEHTVFLKKGSFASRKTDDMLLLQKQNVHWRINPLRR
ncbi:putative membrane-associated, metal-dependent hydrolase [Escherichia coli]|nr:putative membrane-associated, metal-dependent hydrolase [Escherichia coli]